MATLTVVFDTVTKKATFDMGGSAVVDVDCFTLQKRWYPEDADIYYMEICSRSEDEENKTVITHRVMASKDGSIAIANPDRAVSEGDKGKDAPALTPELLKAVASRVGPKSRAGGAL